MRRYSFNVVLIAGLSIVMGLAANLVSARLGFFGPWVAPMGVFFFPLVYVLSDVTSDVYGYRISRWIAWITLAANLIFVFSILFVINVVKSAPWCLDLDQAIRLVLVGTSGKSGMIRVMFAGLAGAVLGGWVNDIIFQQFRHIDGPNKGFAKRKLLSSFGAEIVDTIVFITLAFLGAEGWSITMYIVQFCMKYAVEVITEPLAHMAANKLRSVEQDDVFEDRNKFNIFGFERSSK